MIQVVSQPPKYRDTCSHCGAVLEFEHQDITTDDRYDNTYIICTICNTQLTIVNLDSIKIL